MEQLTTTETQKHSRIAVRPDSLDCRRITYDQEDKSTCSKTPSSCCAYSPSDGESGKSPAKAKKSSYYVGSADEAPRHIVDSVYITHGYRVNCNSVGTVLRSFFHFHHEWFNMWSHFAGFLTFVFLICLLALQTAPVHTNTITLSSNNVQNATLFDKFPSFGNMENIWKKEETRRNQKIQAHASYTNSLDSQLWSTINNIEAFVSQNIKNMSEEEVKAFLSTVNYQVKNIGQTYNTIENNLGASFIDYVSVKSINKTSHVLESKLTSLKNLIKKSLYSFDSEKYDWIDIYKYINIKAHTIAPDHSVHRWPIFVFLATAVFCLGCSTIFHSCNCMPEGISKLLRRIDYAGISILITGSVFPITVYGFYCQPWIAAGYLTLLSVLALGVFGLSLGDKFHSDEYRKFKGILYISMGISAAVPALHLWFNELLFGGNTLPVNNSAAYYWGTGACYAAGLALYVKRIPERFVPGKVNNCGHSHNFWHMFTLIALALNYMGVFENYYTRVAHACPAV
jgi:adiponectin receptor